MFNLDLISAHLRTKECDGKLFVFDPLRKKYVSLTPEEQVRQAFIYYLVEELKYPSGRIGNEISIKLLQRTYRCDTIVYDSYGNPLVIIEYKAPNISITQEVFDQAVRYNMALKVSYIFVTNGVCLYGCKLDYETMQSKFLQEIPPYSTLLGEQD